MTDDLFDVHARPVLADGIAERTLVQPDEYPLVLAFRMLGFATAEALVDLERIRKLAAGQPEVTALVDAAIGRLTGEPTRELVENATVAVRARAFGRESDYG